MKERAAPLDARQVEWSVGTLPVGVYPLRPRTRTWKVNKYTGIEARRTGFWMLPDFGSTAHMIQGATLEAAFADLLAAYSKASMISQIAAYICLSRVKRLESMCVMQPFSPFLFSHGSPAGPERLIRKLSKQISRDEALMEWEAEGSEEHAEPSNEGRKDPMVAKHMCTSCYLKKKSEYVRGEAVRRDEAQRVLRGLPRPGQMDQVLVVQRGERRRCTQYRARAATWI